MARLPALSWSSEERRQGLDPRAPCFPEPLSTKQVGGVLRDPPSFQDSVPGGPHSADRGGCGCQAPCRLRGWCLPVWVGQQLPFSKPHLVPGTVLSAFPVLSHRVCGLRSPKRQARCRVEQRATCLSSRAREAEAGSCALPASSARWGAHTTLVQREGQESVRHLAPAARQTVPPLPIQQVSCHS